MSITSWGGFHLHEVGPDQWRNLWLRGAFPRSFLSRTLKTSVDWRRGFIRTFLERDIPQLGININSTTLRKFWSMLAHYHGQVWNASEISRSFGVAHTTIKHYLDTLTSALVVRQLQPWYENISKRQVKSAKIFIVDSGLLHTLLNIQTIADLEGHPKIGASWEGFVIEQLVRHLDVDFMDCYFWATHSGAELDLLILWGQRRFGFEIKRTSSPKLTASMNSALISLKLNHLYVIHAGDHSFPLADRVDAVSFGTMFQDIRIDPTE